MPNRRPLEDPYSHQGEAAVRGSGEFRHESPGENYSEKSRTALSPGAT